MEDRSGIRTALLLVALAAVVVAALCLSQVVGHTAERAAFGGLTDLAYSEGNIGARLALGGEIKGCGRGDLAASGGNQHVRWMDVSKMRVYFKDEIIRKGAFVICDGVVDAKGRMRLKRITFVVDDPAK